MAKQAICIHCGNNCEVIFRWHRTDPKTGKVIRATSRPFPIPICGCKH